MTSGEILAPLYLVAVGGVLYAVMWLKHRNVMKWKARREAERRAARQATASE